jgi:hypothetical protein
MTRESLEDKGWLLWEAVGNTSVYTRGDPYSQNCIWLTYTLRKLPNVEVRYRDKVLLEGWLIAATVDDLHLLLSKIIWLNK